jgi:hypothetical protein
MARRATISRKDRRVPFVLPQPGSPSWEQQNSGRVQNLHVVLPGPRFGATTRPPQPHEPRERAVRVRRATAEVGSSSRSRAESARHLPIEAREKGLS